MIKPAYPLILLFFFSCSYSATYIHAEKNKLIKQDVIDILAEAEKLGVNTASGIEEIKSWSNGLELDRGNIKGASITFDPHETSDFHESLYTLYCSTKTNNIWQCSKSKKTSIRLNTKHRKDIQILNLGTYSIDEFVEVALVADKHYLISWDKYISSITAIGYGNFKVIFGQNNNCKSVLILSMVKHKNKKTIKVLTGDKRARCENTSINSNHFKQFIVYKNGEWFDKES